MSENIRESGSHVQSKDDLPPPRDRKGVRKVSPPLSNVPLHRFMYYLGIFVVLIIAFYSYRIYQWKAEVGGWWNLALGKHQPAATGVPYGAQATPTPTHTSTGPASVDDRIGELAAALGIPSKDLASAIAAAVHEYVPPASLSSIAAHETGDAARYLVDPTSASLSEVEEAPGATATRGIKSVASVFHAVVGLDDPPSGLDSE